MWYVVVTYVEDVFRRALGALARNIKGPPRFGLLRTAIRFFLSIFFYCFFYELREAQ